MSASKKLKEMQKQIQHLDGRFRLPSSIQASDKKQVRKVGTPPSDQNPLLDVEWWNTCRDETAPGIEHGCFECYTLCASHPEVSGAQVFSCLSRALSLCAIPELREAWDRLLWSINPPETCNWSENQVDPDTWSSESCESSAACSNECGRFCPDEGFSSGTCQTSGSTYLCNCE